MHTFQGIKLALFEWSFLPTSKAVAYMQTFLHGSNMQHFQARSIRSGRLVGDYEVPHEEPEHTKARTRAPSWVQTVMQ